jgi:hypothetical protein
MQQRLILRKDFLTIAETADVCPSMIEYMIPIMNNITKYTIQSNYFSLTYADYKHIITDPALWVNPNSSGSGLDKSMFENIKKA